MTILPLPPLPPPKALDEPKASDFAQRDFAMANPQQPTFSSFFSQLGDEPAGQRRTLSLKSFGGRVAFRHGVLSLVHLLPQVREGAGGPKEALSRF